MCSACLGESWLVRLLLPDSLDDVALVIGCCRVPDRTLRLLQKAQIWQGSLKVPEAQAQPVVKLSRDMVLLMYSMYFV